MWFRNANGKFIESIGMTAYSEDDRQLIRIIADHIQKARIDHRLEFNAEGKYESLTLFHAFRKEENAQHD